MGIYPVSFRFPKISSCQWKKTEDFPRWRNSKVVNVIILCRAGKNRIYIELGWSALMPNEDVILLIMIIQQTNYHLLHIIFSYTYFYNKDVNSTQSWRKTGSKRHSSRSITIYLRETDNVNIIIKLWKKINYKYLYI